jgi:serine phosphatase RsbU (regulator of sigma subunit)
VIIRRSNGKIEELGEEIAGFPLGIMPGMDYAHTEACLALGDVVVIFSDGVTDSRNTSEELYDTKENRRLIKRVAESFGSPKQIGNSILQAIREFSTNHSQADDITLICFGPVSAETQDSKTSD